MIARLLSSTFLVISLLTAADPAWFNQPQFFAFFNGYYWSGDPRVTQVPFTGQAWGGFSSEPNADVLLRREIAVWKSQGGVFFSSTSLTTVYGGTPPAGWDAFRMRTIDGGYEDQVDPRLGTFSVYSLSSPIYQAYLTSQTLHAVDLGADGLQIDDVQMQVGSAIYYPPRRAGSFDFVTMGAFRAYLQQKYSTDILQSQFGIADVAGFDFGNYIRTHGLADTWNKYPLTGLSLEFFLFKRQESLTFLRDLVATTKQYAQQRYNRDFLFSCNANNDPLGYFVADVMDMVTAELFYIRGMDHPFGATDIIAWKGWKSPTIVLAEAMPPTLGVANPLTRPTVNLERLIIADIEAAGGMPGATLQMNQGLQTAQPVDLSVVRRYADFILAHPQLMSQMTTPARIALLNSAPSRLGGAISDPWQTSPWNGPTAYTGTARLLLDSGLTYTSVFLPDITYSSLPSPKAADLARYSLVIAPSVFAIDDSQVATLLAYAQQGGTLVIIGDFATNQPDGAQVSRPELQPLMASPGVKTYGAGRVVYSKELFGVKYQSADNNAQRQARVAFQSFLAPYAQSDVQVSGVSAVIHEPGVAPFFYRDRTGRALVHLVNYDYDDATDQFYTKKNVTVAVRVGTQAVDEVILRSPDMNGAQSLPFERNGETITVTVPQVDAWDVLLFQKNAQPPAISSATPAAAFGVVGGTTIPFSVQASDPDGNPLTYTWAVNGQVVDGVFGPSYTLQLPVSANGICTVTVAVTDGSRTTQRTWSINVAAYRPPRVLFDESHAEGNTIDAARARQLNPEHPSWVQFGILAQAMQPSYQVSKLGTGAITAEVLGSADVLVLAAPTTALTAAENQAIANFVQAGGGLIFLGDSGLNTSINTLIGQWGIQFDPTLILSQQVPDCPGCFYLRSFADHPAVAPDAAFETNYGGSLAVSQNAAALGLTSAAEWRSTSGQPTQQPGDASGPFVMVAAAQAGNGRVFVVSDNAFHDDYLQYDSRSGSLSLFLSALAWLSAPANAAPPAPPVVAAVVSSASFSRQASAAGSIISLFGLNLASSTAQATTMPLPSSLAGVTVFVSGIPTPLYYISPTQINLQVPWELEGQTQASVGVTIDGIPGPVEMVGLVPFSPGIFLLSPSGQGAILIANTAEVAAPSGSIPGRQARPARHEEYLSIYCTGLGPVTNRPASGAASPTLPLSTTTVNPSVTIGGVPATVTYSGLAPGFAGLYQVNVQVPANAPTGDAVPLELTIGGFTSNTVTIALQGSP